MSGQYMVGVSLRLDELYGVDDGQLQCWSHGSQTGLESKQAFFRHCSIPGH